jgi:Ala-tRNA(Pro) deacylase
VETLGIAPGAVTPFSLVNDAQARVTAVFDAGLMQADMLNFHPLRNDRTTAIRARDLLLFAEATGHTPMVLDLPERAS